MHTLPAGKLTALMPASGDVAEGVGRTVGDGMSDWVGVGSGWDAPGDGLAAGTGPVGGRSARSIAPRATMSTAAASPAASRGARRS